MQVLKFEFLKFTILEILNFQPCERNTAHTLAEMFVFCRSIMGFVTKVESQEMLMSKPNGSFLLRFSDSELGGITIAWVADQEGLYQLFDPFSDQWNFPYTFIQLS